MDVSAKQKLPSNCQKQLPPTAYFCKAEIHSSLFHKLHRSPERSKLVKVGVQAKPEAQAAGNGCRSLTTE
jgi:hypothetical protein